MLLTSIQILNITLDNASNNDTMVEELELSLEDFSVANRTHCFMHIVNLIAKSFLKQFDAKKRCGKVNNDDVDLDQLVTEVELDKSQAVNEGEDKEEDDDIDGWVNEVEELTDEEKRELLESIKPIKRVLFKVSAPPEHSWLTLSITSYADFHMQQLTRPRFCCLNGTTLLTT